MKIKYLNNFQKMITALKNKFKKKTRNSYLHLVYKIFEKAHQNKVLKVLWKINNYLYLLKKNRLKNKWRQAIRPR